MPDESLDEQRQRYIKMGLSRDEANELLKVGEVARSWVHLADCLKRKTQDPGRAMDLATKWVFQDVRRALNERGVELGALENYSEDSLAELIVLVESGKISREVGSRVFDRMLETGKSPAEIVEAENLAQTSDAGELEAVVDEVIAENPGPAREFADGVDKAVGRLIGMAKKKTGGKANPKVVREILVRKLRG